MQQTRLLENHFAYPVHASSPVLMAPDVAALVRKARDTNMPFTLHVDSCALMQAIQQTTCMHLTCLVLLTAHWQGCSVAAIAVSCPRLESIQVWGPLPSPDFLEEIAKAFHTRPIDLFLTNLHIRQPDLTMTAGVRKLQLCESHHVQSLQVSCEDLCVHDCHNLRHIQASGPHVEVVCCKRLQSCDIQQARFFCARDMPFLSSIQLQGEPEAIVILDHCPMMQADALTRLLQGQQKVRLIFNLHGETLPVFSHASAIERLDVFDGKVVQLPLGVSHVYLTRCKVSSHIHKDTFIHQEDCSPLP